jgi:hypothetical protein
MSDAHCQALTDRSGGDLSFICFYESRRTTCAKSPALRSLALILGHGSGRRTQFWWRQDLAVLAHFWRGHPEAKHRTAHRAGDRPRCRALPHRRLDHDLGLVDPICGHNPGGFERDLCAESSSESAVPRPTSMGAVPDLAWISRHLDPVLGSLVEKSEDASFGPARERRALTLGRRRWLSPSPLVVLSIEQLGFERFFAAARQTRPLSWRLPWQSLS